MLMFVLWFNVVLITFGAHLVLHLYFIHKFKIKVEKSDQMERRRLFLIPFLLGGILCMASLIWLPSLTINLPTELRLWGLVLILQTIPIKYWAHNSLGPNWAPGVRIRKNHQLISRKGPYKYIRHPIYAYYYLLSIGFFLSSPDLRFGIITLLACFEFYRRAKREEKLLLAKFGQKYQKYMEETGMFFPKLL